MEFHLFEWAKICDAGHESRQILWAPANNRERMKYVIK